MRTYKPGAPKVTMRYAHLSAKALQEAANAGSVILPRAAPKADRRPSGTMATRMSGGNAADAAVRGRLPT